MLWWTDELETGVELIDSQHKSIFKKAHEIFELGVDFDKKELKKMIGFLMGYTNNHFTDEENLMVDYEYKDLLEHRRQHNYFVEEIYKIYLRSTEKIDEKLLNDLKDLVTKWLREHINVHDKKFVDAIRAKEI